MTHRYLIARRTFLRLLAASASMLALSDRMAGGQTNDRGIGGTGAPGAVSEENQDRGIGGTGVVGTIRKFGSIYVNGLRITYPKNVAVRVDGQSAHLSQLKIGQVVHVVATHRNGVYTTRAIDVFSEVVGSVDSVSEDRLVVLGQDVVVPHAARRFRWRVGDHVAVSGLRRPDGIIVASLIEPRAGSMERVAGPVVQASDGSLRIGSLRLMGVDATLVGRRASLSGEIIDGAFSVREQRDEFADIHANTRTVLIESYIENVDGILRAGDGYSIVNHGNAIPAGRVERAILSGQVRDGGVLHVNSLHIESQSSGGGNDGHAPDQQGDMPVPHNMGGENGGAWSGGHGGEGFGHVHQTAPNGGGNFGSPPGSGGPPGFNSGPGGAPGFGPGGPSGFGPGGPGGGPH